MSLYSMSIVIVASYLNINYTQLIKSRLFFSHLSDLHTKCKYLLKSRVLSFERLCV